MLLSLFPWEAGFAFGILSIMGTSVQFAAAIAFPLLSPYCYCLLASGIARTRYLGYAVLFPFLYTAFPNLCKDPQCSEWYHLSLQILANTGTVLELSYVLCVFGFCAGFCETAPVWTFEHEHRSWQGRWMPPVMMLKAAMKAAQMFKDRSWMHSHQNQ